MKLIKKKGIIFKRGNGIKKIIIKKNIILLLFIIYIFFSNYKLKANVFYMATNFGNNISGQYFASKSLNDIKRIKKKILEYVSKCVSKNITKVKNIFLGQNMKFGNKLLLIQNVIFYCEFLGCKNIILDKKSNWFIKNKIIVKKYKMTIKVDEEKNLIYYDDVIIDRTANFFYFKSFIIPERRINVLKNEIFKNLPIVFINKEDLYIYIRSGDIFVSDHPHPGYIQPPSCYYKKILDSFIFHKIYIISENKFNPVIDDLLNRYRFINYNSNSIQTDLAYLVNAHNLVGGGISTFFHSIILLNHNLQLLFQYNMHFKSKLESQKFNVKALNNLTVFEIFAPKEYLLYMSPWTNSVNQREFMTNFIC